MARGTRLEYLQLNIPQKIWSVHLFAFVNYDLFNCITRATQEFVRNVDTWAFSADFVNDLDFSQDFEHRKTQ